MKENLQCTSKYGQLRISLDICHVGMTDIEGFLTINGQRDNLLNNTFSYIGDFVLKGFVISGFHCNHLIHFVSPGSPGNYVASFLMLFSGSSFKMNSHITIFDRFNRFLDFHILYLSNK